MSLNKFKSIREMFTLNGKKAIVTGTGVGIGGAIAYALAELGADVALFDLFREIADLKEILEQRFPVKVLAMQVDVCKRDQVEEAVNLVLKNFEQIDILVNSHGIRQWIPFENMTDEDWNKMINVNLTGVFIMCQVVGRHMIGRGR